MRASRNRGDLKRGGMSAQELAKKFEGRGTIGDAFNDGFDVLTRAIESIPSKEREMVFAGGKVWYSVEIMHTMNPNVINYDRNSLVLHRAGTRMYDEEGKPVDDPQIDKRFDTLLKHVDRMEKAAAKKSWSISGPGLISLKRLDDGTVLDKAISRIDSAMSSVAASDSETLGDYLSLSMEQVINDELPWLDRNRAAALADRMAGLGGQGVVQIVKGLKPDQAKAAKDVNRRAKELTQAAMQPIEMAIHDLAVEVLRGLESMFMMDSEAEVKRLKSEVETAISAIEGSGSAEAMEILEKHMSKLQNADAVSSAMEGIVFIHKGNAYKFTGAFAPVNRILDLYKHGKRSAGIAPIRKVANEALIREWVRYHIQGVPQKKRLTEGGGAFDDVVPVDRDELQAVWQQLNDELMSLGVTRIEPIGTTLKRQTTGDVDLAVEHPDANELRAAAIELYGNENVARGGGHVISIKYPVASGDIQVDMMVGDASLISWSRAGSPEGSAIKGSARAVYLSAILNVIRDEMFPDAEQSSTERTRYTLDSDKGLFRVKQTKQGKRGVTKGWKTLERELVSSRPDEIAATIFGKGTKASDIATFEKLAATFKASRFGHMFNGAGEQLIDGLKKQPKALGKDPKKGMEYVKGVVLD